LTKNVLAEYKHACKLREETLQDIQALKNKEVIIGSVKGSMADFPYTPVNYRVEGRTVKPGVSDQLRREEMILQARVDNCERLKLEVEEYMNNIPTRMQRIIRFRYFKELPWERVADQMGGDVTGESVRKELRRFMKEK
jgi:hypothetical protein